jgi:hypothetical protein
MVTLSRNHMVLGLRVLRDSVVKNFRSLSVSLLSLCGAK